jgi:peptidoglycan/LPS O-acetylase OafA/YrhL
MPGIAYTLPYFAAGIVMYSIYIRFGTSRTIAAVCLVLLMASAMFGAQQYAFAPLGAYLAVFVGMQPNVGSRIARRVGDLSYGIYLFGWPIEQLTQQFTGIRNGWALFACSLPLVLAVAALSWWTVERPFMRLKASRAIASSHGAMRRLVGASRRPV